MTSQSLGDWDVRGERRGPPRKIALALQIGFLRMTGRLLEAVRVVPPAVWQRGGLIGRRQFPREAALI